MQKVALSAPILLRLTTFAQILEDKPINPVDLLETSLLVKVCWKTEHAGQSLCAKVSQSFAINVFVDITSLASLQ